MHDVDILLDIYRHDPQSAAVVAEEHGKLLDLFTARMDTLREGGGVPNWDMLALMARSLYGPNRQFGFKQLVTLAQQYRHQRELLTVLVEGRGETTVFDRYEAIFTPLFLSLRKRDLELVVNWEFALNTWLLHEMERLVQQQNFKRAFDTLVDAARIKCRAQGPLEDVVYTRFQPDGLNKNGKNWAYGTRMRQIADDQILLSLIDMVWRLHRDQGLVPEISEDETSWENQAQYLTTSYGQNCKGSKPQILTKNGWLTMAWLWGAYTDIGEIQSYQCSVSVVKLGSRGWGRYRKWHPVRAPGNKLRLLIRHHVLIAKRKKLQRFCDKHGLEMPNE